MIDILLATYNGENYLRELFDSLLNQSCTNIRIIACDDGSTDRTLAILKEIQKTAPMPFEVHQNRANAGAVQTFSNLMTLSKSSYCMFCDQDDIWKPTKVETTLQAMKQAEQEHGADRPILVHTDLEVVDDKIKRIHPSFWKFTRIYPLRTKTLNRLLVQNVVTGCTAMMNRPLVETCGAIPQGAIMHDWWIALVAAAFGRVVALPEATIYYRQHASNCLGAQPFFSLTALRESLKKQRSMAEKKRRQATKFASAYHHLLTRQQLQLIDEYAAMPQQNILRQFAVMIKNRYYRQGIIRNLAGISAGLLS